MTRWLRFLSAEGAATTTEYAIMLALIAAGLVLAADATLIVTAQTFGRTSAALEGSLAGKSSTSATAGAEVAAAPSGAVSSVSVLHVIAGLAVVAAAGTMCFARYRLTRAKKQVQDLDLRVEPEAVEPHNPNFQKRHEIQKVLLRHFDDVLHSRIEVRHVMSGMVRVVAPDAVVDDLRLLLEREGFHHVLVVDRGALVGVISDRDIKGKKGRTAKEIMTAKPKTVTPQAQVGHAITTLLHGRFSCLPVVENGKLRGILTVTDLLMTLQCLMRLLEKADDQQNPDVVKFPTPARADATSRTDEKLTDAAI